jgi:hypothetical protein
MADTITLIDDRTGKKVTVAINDGVFSSAALRELDRRFLAPLRAHRPSPTSMATQAFCVTADTPLSNSQKRATSLKLLTSC